MLTDLPLRLPRENKARDIGYIHAHLKEAFGAEVLSHSHLQVANELFYRNKAARLVGKLVTPTAIVPFLLPIHRTDDGELFVDTCLTTSAEASIVFGFARSYFMVYAPLPAALVEWLREILPGKTTAELYMAIGCQKHAKTESYREYLRYVTTADEQFIEAPGIRGMVMLVFTLPGFDRVFKVIKDRFAPQKEMTAAHVRACYQLVKEHDRVGRMADTQEFENFVLDKQQIDPALMALLLQEAPAKITDLGDKIAISHLYIERRMVPLNIWLEQSDGQALRDAIEEYGNAIRQLAAANIFPGDMLFKNFGVTRHGRVVFYDYDEICYMTEVNFRDIPPPRYPEDELSSEPWYSVSPGDVFPEEFRHWLCADPRIGPLFEEMHADLFRASYWRGLQTRIKTGTWKMCTLTAVSSGFASGFQRASCRPGKAKPPPGNACLTNPTVRQRDLFRRLNHQRTQLSDPIVGHTRNRPGNRDGGKRLAVLVKMQAAIQRRPRACSSSSNE